MAVWYLRYVYNTPTGHSRCFVLDYDSVKWKVSERKNQSVVNAFQYVLSAYMYVILTDMCKGSNFYLEHKNIIAKNASGKNNFSVR